MAGYKLQGKKSNSEDMIDIPLAAAYDIEGNPINTTYAKQTGSYPNLTAGKSTDSDKLGGVAASGYATIEQVNNKLDKMTAGNSQRAYCVSAANEQFMLVVANDSAVANSIAQRAEGGVLVIGEPISANHATTKNYVDTKLNEKANTSGTYPDLTVGKATNSDQLGGVAASGYATAAQVNNKLDKVTTGNSQRAYCISSANAQSMIVVSADSIADSIAQRGAGGVIIVGTPTAVNHATTKTYVDTGLAGKANTSGKYTGLTVGAADKLTVSGGDSDTPVYFANGVPKACAATLGVSITGNAATATKAINADNAVSAKDYAASGTIKTKFDSLDASVVNVGKFKVDNTFYLGRSTTSSTDKGLAGYITFIL